MAGEKYDEGKQKWHAMPLCVLKPLADVFEAGVKKYSKFNCLEQFEDADERFYDGMMRHIEACQLNPLAYNNEDKCYHAPQAAFNILMRFYHAKLEKDKAVIDVNNSLKELLGQDFKVIFEKP